GRLPVPRLRDDEGPDPRSPAQRQAQRAEPRVGAAAHDLSLLVPHRRDPGDSPDARPQASAAVRRQPGGDRGLPPRALELTRVNSLAALRARKNPRVSSLAGWAT